INDLDTTMALFNSLEEQIHLREIMSEEYKVDLRSKSDAQIAEAVIRHEMKEMLGFVPQKGMVEVGRTFRYNPQVWLGFQTPLMKSVFQVVLDSYFRVAEDGKIKQPSTMNSLKFTINQTTYNMGIGGLHSCEELMEIVPSEDEEM